MRTYIDLDLDLRVHDIVGEVACHCATVAEVVAVQYKAILMSYPGPDEEVRGEGRILLIDARLRLHA